MQHFRDKGTIALVTLLLTLGACRTMRAELWPSWQDNRIHYAVNA
jgi:hypothetical protein